jgi:hypothetical protein
LGQAATFAIKDHFWLFFVDPNQDVTVRDPKLGQKTARVYAAIRWRSVSVTTRTAVTNTSAKIKEIAAP